MNGNFSEMLLGLGAEPKNFTFIQVSIRGIIVMIAALVMIRFGSKRSLAQKTVYDAVLIVVLASVLARVINGSAAFWPTLGGGFVMVGLHRLFGTLACRWKQPKKRWIKPAVKHVPIFFECTCYAGAI